MISWIKWMNVNNQKTFVVWLLGAAGLVLVVIGGICAVGYARDGSFALAIITAMIGVVGVGVVLRNTLSMKIARVIYCLLSASILATIILPHPPGDTAHRSLASLVVQLSVAVFGIVIFPFLKSNKK